jgi:hypothetical protein
VYLTKSVTLKSFGTKYISGARMGLYQSFSSTTLNLFSRANNLSWFIRPVHLLSEGLFVMTWAWIGWMGGKRTKCRSITESALNFWDVWRTWVDGAFMKGYCTYNPFPFLKLNACSSRIMSLAISPLMLLISLYLSPFFVFHLFS